MSDRNNKTIEAMNNLKAGDHFHEMYVHHVYILNRDGENLKVLIGQAPCTLPRDGKVANVTVDEFKNYYAYNSTEGYWVDYQDNVKDEISDWWREFNKLPLYDRFKIKNTVKENVCSECKRPK